MKFEVGEYKTRDGRVAVVLARSPHNTHPLIGYWVDGQGNVHNDDWAEDGYAFSSLSKSERDLLPPPVPVVAWVVAGPDGSVHAALFKCEEDASGYAHRNGGCPVKLTGEFNAK